jgi:cytosine/adenosine deaminase-related metal-dependent hydrolase
MTYRKFKADYLFTGFELAAPDTVLITGGDGIVEAIVPAAEAGEDVETLHGLLSPGFINCHCHLELSHMKGRLPEGSGLVDFLSAVIQGRGQAGVAEGGAAGVAGTATGGDAVAGTAGVIAGGVVSVGAAIAAAEQEMVDGGIVAVGDICNTTDTIPQKANGRLYYHNFIETMGFIEESAASRFAHSVGVFNAFAEAYAIPIESNSIVPHAPYSVSAALFPLIAGFPGNHLLTIHNQESEAENEFLLGGKGDFLRLYKLLGLDVSFFNGTGKRSLESFLPYFGRNQTLILVHNVATTAADLVAAGGGMVTGGGRVNAGNGPDLYFCLCPNANLYIGGQLPDVGMLQRYGCDMVIGTDSLASNHQLSILEELKTLQRAFPELSTPTLLLWATANGAGALQLEALLGSFSAGKQPGVLLIEDLAGDRLQAATRVRRLL